MFLSFVLLFVVRFELAITSPVSSAKLYNVSHNKNAKRSLAATEQNINTYWSQVLEELSVTEDKSRSLKSSAGVNKLEAKSVKIQTTNSRNNETLFQENTEDHSPNEPARGVMAATKRSRKKGRKDRGCYVYIEGDSNENTAEIDIQCETTAEKLSIQQNITDITDSKSIPDTSPYGFQIFDWVDGHLYAIHITPESRLVINELRISGFRNLGAVFLVKDASLEIQLGVVENIFDSQIAGVMSVSNAAVKISRCNFLNTHGTHAGVAIISRSTFYVNSSYFEDNSGTEESLVFYANERSNLTITNSIFLGTLPHTEDDTTTANEMRFTWKNFQVVDADAGVAYLTGGSSLTVYRSNLKHFGTMKGMIYVEKNSSLICKESSLIHNIAIYGGAIFAQDSYVEVINVDAARNAASRGGAILLHGSFQGHLKNITFRNNLAAEGGAFFIELADCQHVETQFLMSIHNCSFINNQAYDHGGAVFTSCVALNITNAAFIDNTAWLGGGAIYINSSYVASLKDVEFRRNFAQEGGAVAVHAEITHGNMTIENTTFHGNDAQRGSGGAVIFHGNHSFLSMNENHFSNNKAKDDGGAVYLSYTHVLNISDCAFAQNTARGGSGGAVHVSMNVELRIERSNIAFGNANQSGGGVFINMAKAVEIHSINITNSTANHGDGGGVALYAAGNITIESTTMHGNSAGGSGGGVGYSNPFIPESTRAGTRLQVDLINVVFSSNTAQYGGGITVHSIETLKLTDSEISDNIATEDGGGIRIHEVSAVNIGDTEMQGNRASKGSGGSVYGQEIQTVTVTKSSFAKSVGYFHGGALYLDKTPNVELQESRFLANEVTSHCGGAVALFEGVKILVNSTFFEKNAAHRSGGAVYLQQPIKADIKESHFLSNVARNEDGGGIYFYFNTSVGNHTLSQQTNHTDRRENRLSKHLPVPVKMVSTEFRGNEAGRHGGGLYLGKLNGTLALVVNPTFEGCKAKGGSGGCAYLANIDALLLERGHQSSNTAYKDGGCLFLSNISRVELNESYFGSCSARSGRGGAFYYDGEPETTNTLLAPQATLANCEAAEGGAVHLSNVNDLVLDQSNIYENKASKGSGGSIFATRVDHASLKSLRVRDSQASAGCGAMCFTHIVVLKLSGFFSSNTARSSHGGVAWLSDINHMTIKGSEFTQNKGGGFGGALHMTRVVKAHISRSNFSSNIAGLEGGGVSVGSFDDISILNSNFTGNNARDGAGLHIGKTQRSNNSLIQVRDCIFEKNKADKDGGGAVVNEDVTALLNSLTSDPPSSLSADFLNCSFYRNRARNGGGLGALAGDVRVMNGSFVKNSAGGSGGAMYINDDDFVVVNDSQMVRNHAHKGGAAVITCNTHANFTYTLIRRNTAPRRDDGAILACAEANLFLANVTLIHNFRDHDWWYYILIPVCSYSMLVAFLFLGIYVLRSAFRPRKNTVTYETYSDIGEYDPSATDLTAFFAEPAAEVESDDDAIVAPKPSPSDPEPRSSHRFGDTVHKEGEAEIGEESDEESLPLPQHRYPPQV